ncbi:MAG: D-alanyl-D-alanine carboxypeptidase [Pseudomonadota bacterium]
MVFSRLNALVNVRNSVLPALVLALSAFLMPSQAAANSKYAAIVVHADSGDVLFSRYADKRLYPASLTKMMTLYLLFEEIEAGRLSMSSKLKVSSRAAGQPASKLGVRAGTTITVEAAIKALIVKSANDVAVVVAEAISGTEWQFARQMTTKARALGMRSTTFANASGLPNRRMLTTARDLTKLSRRLIQDFPQHYALFETKQFSWNGRNYRTHNSLVKTYKGADGLKTGYTRRSGYNLATSAVRGNDRLIGIVLGGRSGRTRDAHMRDILNTAFARIKKKPTLISALHRNKPTPSLKPGGETLAIASLNAPSVKTWKQAIVGSSEVSAEVYAIAKASDDQIGTLLQDLSDPTASSLSSSESDAVIDDLNQFEGMLLAKNEEEENLPQGDIDASMIEQWDVQVGAYSDKARAIKELERIALSAELTEYARMVSPMDGATGQKIYRARFVSLSESEAQLACKKIKKPKQPCMVIHQSAN